ncbi:MAG: molybdate ABC transporter permease subunit [Alphaproteobacteria bacterium]|nr:molybdate ABC transporter permease subunit [Alphaproteobacteria bacterium]
MLDTLFSALTVDLLWLSLRVSMLATLGGTIPALLLAWLLARKNFIGKSLVDGLVHLPLLVPPVVIGYILLLSFGPRGPIGQFIESTTGFSFAFNWYGAALAAGIMGLPLMVRAFRLGFESVDADLEDAARVLGASDKHVFFYIILPLIKPSLIVGVVLGFSRALGEFGATVVFVANIPGKTQTLPLAIYNLSQFPGREYDAAGLGIVSFAIALGALWFANQLAPTKNSARQKN